MLTLKMKRGKHNAIPWVVNLFNGVKNNSTIVLFDI